MTQQTSPSTQAWLLLGALALIWGASFLSIRIALDEVPPLTAVAHRTFWAMLVLWGYVALRRLPVPRQPKIWNGFLVMGLLNNAIPFSLMAWGQLHIESGLTSILNAATAVFGVLVAAIFLRDERLNIRKLIGVCLGFAGVVIAIGAQNLANFDIKSLAQLSVILGTISYAFASVWAKLRLSGLRPEVAAAGMLTGGALIMVPLAAFVEGPPRFDLTLRSWSAIAYYALIATAFAYLLYYRILKLAGSGNLMLVTLLLPPVAILLGAAVLGEALNANAYLGFLLLSIGLIIIDGRILRRRAPR